MAQATATLPREFAILRAWQDPPGPLDVRALLVVGELTDAPVYLNAVPRLRHLLPRLEVTRLPGQRHIGHAFAAEEFARLVDGFLAE